MSAASRELRWAAITLAQLPGICSLTFVGGFLTRYAWFRGLFLIPNETVLVPFWLGLALTIPVSAAVLTVLALDVVRVLGGYRVWVTAIEHVLAAMFGGFVYAEWTSWTDGHGLALSAGVLADSYFAGNIVLILIYWPRLAFRSLRAPRPSSPH